MSFTLPEIIQRARLEFSLPQTSRPANTTYNNQLDDPFAYHAQNTLVYLCRENLRITTDAFSTKNKGWFIRQQALSFPEPGVAYLPPDIEVLIGVSDSQLPYQRLFELLQTGLIGGCFRGDYVRQGDFLRFNDTSVQSNRYVIYNSNQKGTWFTGTVSSSTSTVVTPSTTPTYASVPLVSAINHYEGMELEVTFANGTKETRRIKSWNGTSFTMYEAFNTTPSAGNIISTRERLGNDEMLLYEFGRRLGS